LRPLDPTKRIIQIISELGHYIIRFDKIVTMDGMLSNHRVVHFLIGMGLERPKYARRFR